MAWFPPSSIRNAIVSQIHCVGPLVETRYRHRYHHDGVHRTRLSTPPCSPGAQRSGAMGRGRRRPKINEASTTFVPRVDSVLRTKSPSETMPMSLPEASTTAKPLTWRWSMRFAAPTVDVC